MLKSTLTEEAAGEDAPIVEVRVKDATNTVEATPTVRVEVEVARNVDEVVVVVVGVGDVKTEDMVVDDASEYEEVTSTSAESFLEAFKDQMTWHAAVDKLSGTESQKRRSSGEMTANPGSNA